jgi:hypothetical protein
MKDYCITLRITKPDLSSYEIKFNDAIVIKREDGILVKHMTCNGELLAYYPLTWVIEVIKVDIKENN